VIFPRYLASTLSLLVLALSPALAAPDLKDLSAPIRDYSATVKATKVNTPELVKISKSYANSFRIKTTRVYYKTPNHVKVAGSIGPLSVTLVINDNTKKVKMGPIRHTVDLSDKPGQKSGLMDFGVITDDQLEDYTWKFVRRDGPLYVYELRFKNLKEDPSRRLVWVDPVHKVMTRRMTYKQYHDNDLKMDLRFEGVKAVAPGVYVPTIVKVYNAEGKLGAVSQISAVRVNRGISLKEFDL
jgi:hypothetical protein